MAVLATDIHSLHMREEETLPPNIRAVTISKMNADNLHGVIHLMKDTPVQAVTCRTAPPSKPFRDFTVALGKNWERDPANDKPFYLSSGRLLAPYERPGILTKHFGRFVEAMFFPADEARSQFLSALHESPITAAFKRASRGSSIYEEWLSAPAQLTEAVTALWPRALVSYEIDGTMLMSYMSNKYRFHYHSFINDMKDTEGDHERADLLSTYCAGFYINYSFCDDSTVFMGLDGKTIISGQGWGWNVFTTQGHPQGASSHSGPLAEKPDDIQKSILIARVYPHPDDLFPG